MHNIEIREQNAYLLESVKDLLFASQALMRAATGENPPANLSQAKDHIMTSCNYLLGIAGKIG